MEIKFRKTISNNKYESNDCHSILVDGEEIVYQREGIEPEDVRFCRDLRSPHFAKSLIEQVLLRKMNGENISLVDETINEDDED